MSRERSHGKGRLLPAMLAVASAMGCTTPTQKYTGGPFTQVSRIESELQRGVSTKRDVQRVLGSPKGTGHTVLPTDPTPRDAWFYSDIELTDTTGEKGGIIHVDVRQQILLLFFKQDIFDGFLWFSNAGVAKEK